MTDVADAPSNPQPQPTSIDASPMTPSSTRPFPLITTADLAAKKGSCIAVYGAPGVGKTPAVCAVSETSHGNTMTVLDAEGGLESALHFKNIRAIPIPLSGKWDWESIEQIVKWYDSADQSEITEKAISFDNMSEIAELCLWFHTTDLTQNGGPRKSPEIQHYKRCTIDMRWLTRTMRDVAYFKGVNVFLVAWEAPEKDEATGILKRDVCFSPGFAREFPGLVDIVAHITVDGSGKRSMQLGASNRCAARFRRNKFQHADQIPDKFEFTIDTTPLADIIATTREQRPWPKEKYKEVKL